ncbi:MAG TPA: lysoplasmalogenase [Clostridiales bacterium]|nr:lysoplasmalogenase [Clostridiales bacterium]
MPQTLYIILPISLVFALFSGFFNLRENPFSRVVSKTIASLLFVVAGILSFAHTTTKYSVLIIVGLICGMIGDIFLTFDDQMVNERDKHFFLFGGIAFAIGHIFYIVFFFNIVNSFNFGLMALIILLPVIMMIVSKIAEISAGKITMMLPFYFLIIALMAASTINFHILNNNIGSKLALSAGILFVASDIALIFKTFSKFKNNIVLVYFVLLTYYVAQGLFATMIFFI